MTTDFALIVLLLDSACIAASNIPEQPPSCFSLSFKVCYKGGGSGTFSERYTSLVLIARSDYLLQKPWASLKRDSNNALRTYLKTVLTVELPSPGISSVKSDVQVISVELVHSQIERSHGLDSTGLDIDIPYCIK